MRLIIRIVPVLAAAQILSSCAAGEDSPNQAQFERAKAACEQVGLKSGTPEVSDCAASLQSALNTSSAL
jgi:uncharacterized protein YbjT (DUF2867 family)